MQSFKVIDARFHTRGMKKGEHEQCKSSTSDGLCDPQCTGYLLRVETHDNEKLETSRKYCHICRNNRESRN